MSTTPKIGNGDEKEAPQGGSMKRGTSFKATSNKREIAETNSSILKKESSYLNNNSGQSRRLV
jgi:hypothetical protein